MQAGSPPGSAGQQQQQFPGFQLQPGAQQQQLQQPMSAGSPTSHLFLQQQQQQAQQQQQVGMAMGMMNGQPGQPQQQPGPWGLPPGLDRDKLAAMTQRMSQLRSQGMTEQTSPELAQIAATLMHIQRQINQWKQMQTMQQARQMQANQQGQPQMQAQGMQQPAQLQNGQQPAQFQPQQQQPLQMNGYAGPPAGLGQPQLPNTQQQQMTQMQQQHANGLVANGNAAEPASSAQRVAGNSESAAAAPSPQQGQASQTTGHVVLTPQQMAAFKAQIIALRYLQKGQPIPPQIASLVFNSVQQPSQSPSVPPQGTDSPAQIAQGKLDGAETSVASQQQIVPTPDIPKDNPLAPAAPILPTPPPEPELEIDDIPPTLIAPYTAFKNPRQVLASLRANIQNDPYKTPSLPSLLPAGLDPNILQQERNKFIEARIAQRKKELENLPSTLGDGSSLGNMSVDDIENLPNAEKQELLASQKLKALIELKSLNLLQRQRQLREDVFKGFNQACSLSLITDRQAYRSQRRITLKDARMIDQLERQQKIDRENRAKQKHLDQLLAIAKHGKAMVDAHEAHRARAQRLGKNIMRWHVEAEKEEQRRVERISKERLKALKNDDEETYLKLLSTTKNSRIAHLLSQTDSFLDSLAQAVAAQQAEASGKDGKAFAQAQKEGEETVIDEGEFGAAPVFQDEATESSKVDYYNVAHRIKEVVTEQPKLLVGGQLKEYQLKGLQWMISLYNNRLNGILADEMGLGKTIQTISLVTYLIEKKRQQGPFLCIVPLSTLPNWQLEFAKWAPQVKVAIYKGTPPVRKALQQRMRGDLSNFQVCLTTYEYIIKDRPFLARYKWVHMIIDEGHRMKNTQSKLSQTLTQYYSTRYRLILTGTPLQNNLPELWALLNFVLPKIFNSQKSFDEWFNTPFASAGSQDKIEITEEEALLIIRRLHKVLRPFLLRRLKKDVEADLPDKVERLIRCKMSALQSRLYKQMFENRMLITGDGAGTGKGSVMKGLQNALMQLRKICNHPFVFPQVEDAINPTHTSNALLYRVAGKFELLDRILPKLWAGNHRVLMFFQMTEIMTIMEDYLRFRNTECLRLDGSTKPEERADMLRIFNAPDSPYKIFLLSTRAGGLGLNLQTADTVIIFDSDWNPHQDLQAQDRAHRIGQKKEVRIFRLVTNNSVEEKILDKAREKLEIDKKVIQGGRFDNKSSAQEREAFFNSLLAKNDEDEEDLGDLTDEELNEIIARSEEEAELFAQMDVQRAVQEQQDWYGIYGPNAPPMPDRLMADEELPEAFRRTVVKQAPEVVSLLMADSRRKKDTVFYDDGLTEEQFLNAVENEDYEGVVARNRTGRLGTVVDDDGYSGSDSMLRVDSQQDWGSEGGSPGPGGGKKRKRGTANTSRAASVDVSINGDAKPKRRKTGKQLYADDPERLRMKEQMDALMTAMEDVDNPTFGYPCAGAFYDLPSKRDFAFYYVVIKNAISLNQIQKKIDTFKYDTMDDFVADVRLMIANCRTYNQDTAEIYKDAGYMEDAFRAKLGEFGYPVPPPAQPHIGMLPEEGADTYTESQGAKSRKIIDSDDE